MDCQNIDLLGGFIYLILISVSFIPFWNKRSIPTLSGCIPLVTLNFIAQNPSFRTLIHQYNLPIALDPFGGEVDISVSSNPTSLRPIIQRCQKGCLRRSMHHSCLGCVNIRRKVSAFMV